MKVLLVGAGNMAKEHVKVLKELNIDFKVIGRSESSATEFEAVTGVPVATGGLEQTFDKISANLPTHAIIATTLESLEQNARFLLKKGVKNILIEKPGAFTYEGLVALEKLAIQQNAKVYIAYNRRFYASVIEVQNHIEQEGGLTSFVFEFTEWAHTLNNGKRSAFKLENWFIGNSTHVIDTAFFLGGKPKEIQTFTHSNIDWHPSGSIFSGAGITEKNILFSYHANWSAPGRWSLELMTKQSRYFLRPFEKLSQQKLGTLDIQEVTLNDTLDTAYKPGVFRQVETFLFGGSLVNNLLSVHDARILFLSYNKINGGK